jgi:acyl carrier protein
MTKAEITEGVKGVIAKNSRYTIDEIKVTDPLDKFITSFMKAKLAGQVKRKFSKVNTTTLTNVLYESIKKVSQLIEHINNLYNPEA